MPTENWYPITGATHDLAAGLDDYTNTGGANKNASCRVGGGRAGPATHDDATSYISRPSAGEQALNVDWPGPMVTWDGVLTANQRSSFVSGGSNNRFCTFYNAAGASSAAVFVSVSESSGGFVDTGPANVAAGATYAPSGAAWVATDFVEAGTFIGFGGTADCAYNATSVWGTISFTPPVGGFAFLLQLAGLGALPLAGAMDFSHFTRFLSWRRATHLRHTLLTPAEVRIAWDEIRAYRHPVYSWA